MMFHYPNHITFQHQVWWVNDGSMCQRHIKIIHVRIVSETYIKIIPKSSSKSLSILNT